jgi:hypothetical protein
LIVFAHHASYTIFNRRQARDGIPPDRQRLIYAGIVFDDDDATVDALGIHVESTLHLVVVSGATKRKNPEVQTPEADASGT